MAKLYIMFMGPLFFAALMLAGYSARFMESEPAKAKRGFTVAALMAGIPLLILMVLAYRGFGV